MAALLALASGLGGAVAAGPEAVSTVFTEAQAATGRETYEAFCIACHQADLGGQNEALPLKGPHFRRSWGHRTTRDLFTFISREMPPGQATLSEREYLGLVAYLLQSNGAAAGAQPLTALTQAVITSVVPVAPGGDGPPEPAR